MKKVAIAVLATILLMLCVACNSDNNGGGNYSDVSVNDVLKLINDSVGTVTAVEVGTEETDGNNLLGKANQYIELGWFMDERVISEWDDDPEFETSNGGTLEKFANTRDARTRHEYLAGFSGFLAQYSEIYGVWVIRLSNDFTASQQSELTEIIKNVIRELD